MQAESVQQASSAPSPNTNGNGAISTEKEKNALRFRGTRSIKPAPGRMIEYVFDLDADPLTADTVQGYIRRKISVITTKKIFYTITTEIGQFHGGIPIEKDLNMLHGKRSQEDSDGITLCYEGPHIFYDDECLLDNHLTPEKEALSKILVNKKLKEHITGVYYKGKFQYGSICCHISLNKQIPITLAYMSTKVNDKDSLCCLYSEQTGDIHAVQNAELNTQHTIWFIIKTKDETLYSITAVSNIQNPFKTRTVLEILPGGTLFQSNHFFSPPKPTKTLWEIACSMEGQLTYTKHQQTTLYKLDDEKQTFWRKLEELLMLMGRIKTRFIASSMTAPIHKKVETKAINSTQQAELDKLLAEWTTSPKTLKQKPKPKGAKPTPSQNNIPPITLPKLTPKAPDPVDEPYRSICRTSSSALTTQTLSIKTRKHESIPHTKPIHLKSPIHAQPKAPFPVSYRTTPVNENDAQMDSEIVSLIPQQENTEIPNNLSPLLPGEIRIPNVAPTPIANWSLTP